jgi:hypothetical protein
MSQLHCSPKHHEIGLKTGTCYTENDLVTIADSYNKYNPNEAIDVKAPKKVIHNKLKEKLKDKCGDKEYCWLDLSFIDFSKKKELEDAFRPKKPRDWYNNNRTWLNTYDILYVMEQYEDRYKDFVFLGVHPIDFQKTNAGGNCVGEGMCDFHIRNMIGRKKKRFGLVINTDPHNRGGQHWFAIYCNLNPRKKNFGIYHYDSVAYPPNGFIKEFMTLVTKQVEEIYSAKVAKRFQVLHNKVRRQYKNTECGVFSIVYLTQCLKGIPFPEICERMRTDDEVNKLRDVLYRPS